MFEDSDFHNEPMLKRNHSFIRSHQRILRLHFITFAFWVEIIQ